MIIAGALYMKRYLLFICMIILFTGTVFGQSVWEGSAAMGRYGEFPITGLYGASNSFARNTLVEVENVENNRKSTVIIVGRLEDSGLFILLSRDAAGELGITQEEIAQVKVSMVRQDNSRYSGIQEDLPYNPDPDINPAAGIDDLREFLLSEGIETVPVEEESVIEGAGEVIPEQPEEEIRLAIEIPQEETPEEMAAETPVEEEVRVEPRSAEADVEVEEPPEVINDLPDAPEEVVIDIPELDLPEEVIEEPEEVPVEEVVEEPALPEEETPRISELMQSPEEVRDIEIAALDEPETLPKEQTPAESVEAPTVVNDFIASPELEGEIELAELDLPKEPAGTEPAEPEDIEETPVFIEEEIAAFVPIPEDAELVLEPAEPRPPEDMIPKAINGFLTPLAGEASSAELSVEERDLPELVLEEPEDELIVEEPVEPIEEIPYFEEDVLTAEEETGTSLEREELDSLEIREPELETARTEEAEPEYVSVAPEAASLELERGSYYLQLGAFTEQRSADTLASTLSDIYPVTIYETDFRSQRVYKVMIGPVTGDESGSLLYNLKAKGYKGAFLHRPE